MDVVLATMLMLVVKVLYAICVISLFLVGLGQIINCIIYIFHYKEIWNRPDPPQPAEWPRVTVQLPIYNEKFLGERVIDAVAKFNYPREKLEIQVLDDSTDEQTINILKTMVQKYRQEGIDINYLHREDRVGYKAGNLAFGLKHASGDFLAIFDADFIPGSDWLKKTVPCFQDPKIGFVQTRWDHINFKHNLITRMAGQILDGSFIIEQNARFYAGLIISFPGSAGIWRKECIESVGGWEWDTMTEDADMTFRTQIAGWKGYYLPKVVAMAELPQEMDDFKIQQYRWCRGTAQVAFKLMRRLLPSKLPLKVKFMGMLHLLSFLTFPFMDLLFLLVLPVSLWAGNFIALFWWGAFISIGPALVYGMPRTEHTPHVKDRLEVLPFLLLVGVGISLVCGLSVISGLFQKGGVFIRTTRADPRIGREYDGQKKRILNLFTIGEVAMGVYLIATLLMLWHTVGKLLSPWLGTSAIGFLFVAGTSLYQNVKQGIIRHIFPEKKPKEDITF